MEVLEKAEVYMVNMQCDKCGKGIMQDISEGVALCSCPAQYPHKCSGCGHVENYTCQYPYPKVIAEKEAKLYQQNSESKELESQ